MIRVTKMPDKRKKPDWTSVVIKVVDITIIIVVLIFAIFTIYLYLDHIYNPAVYALDSAPWYLGVIMYGGVMSISVLVLLLLRYITRKCQD